MDFWGIRPQDSCQLNHLDDATAAVWHDVAGQDGKLFLYAVTEKLTLAFNVANGARVSGCLDLKGC